MTTPSFAAPVPVESLDRQFGIPGSVQVVAGNGGLPKVVVSTPACRGELYLHGAQVTAWKPAQGEEVIFLSQKSYWEQGRAIRGGIPICFPWFRAKTGDPKAPSHGFVRTRAWQLDSVVAEGEGSVAVSCSTQSDESTRQWFPHEFRLVHRITFGATLQLALTATNTSHGHTADDIFLFEEALHTYFRVGDAEQVRVHGLEGDRYLDNTDNNEEKTQRGDVALTRATDNAYFSRHAVVDLVDPVVHRTLRTEKENSATTIVWNPWQQGAVALADLGDDEWRSMTCVEASNILAATVTLGRGQSHTLRVQLSVEA